ncbi:hypothetical protein C0J52_11449 [Blattella germanica]|nr:hypothetical protein C0J52_11449 [Blattella germanica]
MVDIKKVKKGGPVKITIEGICDPNNASSSNTKKATDCTIGEADKNKDCITEPYVQSQPPKTEKSISSNTKKNIGNTSKKFMLSHDISKIQKRAYSTSPMNRVVGNKIYERAIVPYPVVDVDNISKIKLKSTSRPSLKIKVPQPIKTMRTLKTQHKIYEKKKRQENGILQTKLAKEYSPSKIHNKSPFVQVKANSYYLPADCVNIERIKDLSYQYLPTEETSYDSYLTFINKFPQMMQRTVGSNCLSDIWSYCQKDLPLNSILKVPVSVNQKSNPKVDLPVSQSRLSQTKEADKCENIDAEENK